MSGRADRPDRVPVAGRRDRPRHRPVRRLGHHLVDHHPERGPAGSSGRARPSPGATTEYGDPGRVDPGPGDPNDDHPQGRSARASAPRAGPLRGHHRARPDHPACRLVRRGRAGHRHPRRRTRQVRATAAGDAAGQPHQPLGGAAAVLDRDRAGGRAVAADGAAPGRAAGPGGHAHPGRVRVAQPGHPGLVGPADRLAARDRGLQARGRVYLLPRLLLPVPPGRRTREPGHDPHRRPGAGPGGRGHAGSAEVLLLVGHPAWRLGRQRLRNARRRGRGRAGPGRTRHWCRPRRRPHSRGRPGGCDCRCSRSGSSRRARRSQSIRGRTTPGWRPAMSSLAAAHPGDGRQPRLYGNWRAERGWGIGHLSTTATIIVFLAVLAPLLAASTAPAAVLPLAGVGVVVVAAIVVRIGGRSAADVLGVRLRFWRARRRGWARLSAGVLADDTRGADLPGVLAPLRPLDIDDGRGRRHVLLHNRRTGTLTAILRCAPTGLDLADSDQADQWVAAWGGVLADLGYQPLVRHLAVTVDTAPTGGDPLTPHVATHLQPCAPRLARQVLSELVADTTARTASVQVWLSVCLDPNRATPKPADLLAACVEVGRWLPGLETELAGCGVAVQGRATLTWLTGAVRAEFDPAVRPHVAAAGLEWADAVPVAALEDWDLYRHESGVSVSWALREAPRQAVDAAVLAPLVAPGPYARRVCWLYQPYPADQAAAKVEAQVTAGQIRRAWATRTRRDETQRDRDDRDRALQAAREEAAGAGVGRFTLYTTTTVTDDTELSAAVADVEQRAGQARLRLRRLRGAQAAGFAAALGFGINPVDLARRGRP